jgi:hypothetical protein
MKKTLILRGILYLVSIPALLGIIAVPVLGFSLFDKAAFLVLALFSIVLYVAVLLQPNAYTDSEVLDLVQIPNAGNGIEKLLKTRTIGTNRLINCALISILGEKNTLHQSDFGKYLKKADIDLTQPAVNTYLSRLEMAGILASAKGIYTVDYSLTKKGQWCYDAVKKCFPKRFFFFVIRHYLGLRNLPPFQNGQTKNSTTVLAK